MQLDGIILKGIGGFYYVEAAEKVFECKARGIFRKDKISPLPGDHVTITVRLDDENTIDEIQPRRNLFLRPPLANIDRLFIITSVCEPSPSTLIIDKQAAIARSKNIESVVVITKTDLGNASELFKIYKKSGIETYCFSMVTGEGVEQIRSALNGHISAFTGNSGVGKSTLLNLIDDKLMLKTAEISSKLNRGRHTTRATELFKVEGGYVADTPGFASLDFENSEIILREELPFCFQEFLPHLGKCRYSTCSHIEDMGCSILAAVKSGEISESRHKSYVTMYNEVKNKREWNA
jgi:ribosome biogenesis GTPase / thiamine phosphate phosphatase